MSVLVNFWEKKEEKAKVFFFSDLLDLHFQGGDTLLLANIAKVNLPSCGTGVQMFCRDRRRPQIAAKSTNKWNIFCGQTTS